MPRIASRTNAAPPMYATAWSPLGNAVPPAPVRRATTGSASRAVAVAAAAAARPVAAVTAGTPARTRSLYCSAVPAALPPGTTRAAALDASCDVPTNQLLVPSAIRQPLHGEEADDLEEHGRDEPLRIELPELRP